MSLDFLTPADEPRQPATFTEDDDFARRFNRACAWVAFVILGPVTIAVTWAYTHRPVPPAAHPRAVASVASERPRAQTMAPTLSKPASANGGL